MRGILYQTGQGLIENKKYRMQSLRTIILKFLKQIQLFTETNVYVLNKFANKTSFLKVRALSVLDRKKINLSADKLKIKKKTVIIFG